MSWKRDIAIFKEEGSYSCFPTLEQLPDASSSMNPQLCPDPPNIWKLLKALTPTAETSFLPACHAREMAFVVPIRLFQ